MPTTIPIRACPSCNQVMQSPKREAAPNVLGWKKTEEAVRISRCPGCDTFFWVEDAKLVGELPMTGLYKTYDVSVVAVGEDPKAVFAALGCGAKPAPFSIADAVSREAADSMNEQLSELGAKVEITLAGDPRWTEWRSAPGVRALGPTEYKAALAAGCGTTPDREQYLKHRIADEPRG